METNIIRWNDSMLKRCLAYFDTYSVKQVKPITYNDSAKNPGTSMEEKTKLIDSCPDRQHEECEEASNVDCISQDSIDVACEESKAVCAIENGTLECTDSECSESEYFDSESEYFDSEGINSTRDIFDSFY